MVTEILAADYSNPYEGATFWSFLLILLTRLYERASGHLPYDALAHDELQAATLCCVALSGAFVGTFLVLRRMAMLANALSHTILLGIVGAYLWAPTVGENLTFDIPTFFVAAMVTGLLTAFVTEFFNKTLALASDASTGLSFTLLFALGIVLVTLLTRNAHIGAEVVIGNVDALQPSDLMLAGLTAFINIAIILLLFKEYTLTTFDPAFATAVGISSTLYHYLLMGQVSLAAVSGFRAVGVLMVLALLTVPPLMGRLLYRRLASVLACASVVGVIASLGGVALARHLLSVYSLPLSTAGLTVTLLTLLFLAVAISTALKKKYLFKKSGELHP